MTVKESSFSEICVLMFWKLSAWDTIICFCIIITVINAYKSYLYFKIFFGPIFQEPSNDYSVFSSMYYAKAWWESTFLLQHS